MICPHIRRPPPNPPHMNPPLRIHRRLRIRILRPLTRNQIRLHRRTRTLPHPPPLKHHIPIPRSPHPILQQQIPVRQIIKLRIRHLLLPHPIRLQLLRQLQTPRPHAPHIIQLVPMMIPRHMQNPRPIHRNRNHVMRIRRIPRIPRHLHLPLLTPQLPLTQHHPPLHIKKRPILHTPKRRPRPMPKHHRIHRTPRPPHPHRHKQSNPPPTLHAPSPANTTAAANNTLNPRIIHPPKQKAADYHRREHCATIYIQFPPTQITHTPNNPLLTQHKFDTPIFHVTFQSWGHFFKLGSWL